MPPQAQPQYLSTDPNEGAAAPSTSQYLSTDPNEGTPRAATPPPSPLQPSVLHPTTWRERMARWTPSKETQRMLAGGVGAAAVGAATEGLGLLPEAAAGAGVLARGGIAALRALPSITGAAAGGGSAAALQGAPPHEIAGAAEEQAALETGAKIVGWPLRAAGRRLLAHPVAQAALDTFKDVASRADAAVRGTREGVALAVNQGREAVRGAAGVARSTTQAAEAAKTATASRWPAIEPPPGAYQEAGQRAADVVAGPATRSKNRIGAAVEDAAKSGPQVNISKVKSQAEAMAANARPSTIGAEGTAPTGTWADAAAAVKRGSLEGDTSGSGAARLREALTKAGVPLEDAHPLPGVLGQLQDAPDVVSFMDAHRFKRLLDDAVNWDSPARKQVQQITKGTRTQLRSAMAGHQPYEDATAAYSATAKLFEKGSYAKALTDAATANPEKVVKLIKGDEPTKLQMLQEVLLHHAEQGGGAAQGQAAWDGIRAAWTHEHLIRGGIEKFPDALAKVHSDVLSTLYGDDAGKTVLGNLQQISDAYQHVVSFGDEATTAAKATVRTARDTANRTAEQGRVAVTTRQNEAGAAREQLKQMQAQPIAHAPPPGQAAVRLLKHPLGSIGHAVQFFMDTPSAKDLTQWAAYSTPRTQAMVKAMTGPAPAMALADLARVAGIALTPKDIPQRPPGDIELPAARPSLATPPPR